MGRVMGWVGVVALAAVLAAPLAAQVAEFDFCREFRGWMQSLPRAQRETPQQIVEHEDEIAASEFFGRSEMPIARLVAEKPAP